ncbi:hypothetical protein U9M48_029790 [Paspalum notatum var. saurae]|uniref:Uncharacterized protein n=1 Tax=Paspalum notatum var. saurae TaxID=547442 RepID=A0AAQ3X2K1_PASNO
MDHHRSAANGAGIVAPAAAIVILTVTCALAIHRAAAARDAASVAFVAVSYGALLLLLLRCLRAYYALALAAERERLRLRRKVWALGALLTAMFAWKVAAVVPWWPAAVVDRLGRSRRHLRCRVLCAVSASPPVRVTSISAATASVFAAVVVHVCFETEAYICVKSSQCGTDAAGLPQIVWSK